MKKIVVVIVVLSAVSAGAWLFREPLFNPIDRSLTDDDVVVDFWYGPRQSFGHLGVPQAWINVLGDVQPADQVAELSFRVDGGESRPLTVGSDLHRLARDGDFNAEIAWHEVGEGTSEVVVEATMHNGVVARRSVALDVTRGGPWPLPYEIDFGRVDDLQDVLQVVDGRWRLDPDGVRTAEPFYDRVLTLGDSSWTNYEADVRLTIHDFTPPAGGPPTYNVTHFGVAMRWRGHHDDGLQPRRKWYPLGAQGEFFVRSDPDSSRWRILRDQSDDKPQLLQPDFERVAVGVPLRVRTQVVTLPDGRTRYRFKQWVDGEPEPGDWDAQGFESDDYPSGALCLVPHNTDVTIHEVRVTPISIEDALASGSATDAEVWYP